MRGHLALLLAALLSAGGAAASDAAQALHRSQRTLAVALRHNDFQQPLCSYAYGYGLPARLAMQTYLSLAGRGKIGFSQTSERAGAPPRPIDGLHAAIERNTMRHYLALGAYMDSLSAPAATRNEQRLAAWFDATERYALQLHEMERDDYLSMQRKELRLQP
ncbi:MAG: hypothetical protein IV092_16210 [Burkholderiaceae bacterium]|nr:hypothetical protein [Burkholderiaceae bacterium]